MTKIDEWAKENRLDYDSYKDMILGLKKAIAEELDEIYRNKRFVTGNIVSQQKEEEAYMRGWKACLDKVKKKLCGEGF